jgi:diguanylate cyclase (GGDEF)-like protein
MVFLEKVVEYPGKLPKGVLFLLCLLLIATTSILDYIARDFSLLVLNLIPISLGAWFIGLWAAIAISLAGAAASLVTDIVETPAHSHYLVHYWNMAAQFVFFALSGFFLVELKNSLLREMEYARRDSLTGALNGRAFIELAWREISRSRRYNNVFTFAYLDIDNFKDINDRFGHAAGDALLRAVTDTLKGNLRNIDIVARLGGDEFALILPETPHESSTVVMSRLRDLLVGAMKRGGWPATFSIGVVTYKTAPDSVDAMIRRADELMYQAKNAGKDMIRYDIY